MKLENILLAAMSLDYGGAETHVVDLAEEVRDRGFNVTVASAGGRLTSRLEASRIPHFVVPMNSRSPIKLITAVNMLRTIVIGRGIDLLHAHGRIPAWALSQVQKHQRIPLVTTYHGVYAAGFPWSIFTRQGDIAIAVSEDIKAHFVGKLGFDASRVKVIPNGIDTDRFAPGPYPELRKTLVGDSKSPLVVNVSRLDEFAGVASCLARSLLLLDADYPGISTAIVGDGDHKQEVDRACDEVNAVLGRKAAIAVGGQYDVVPYLLSGDITVAVARSALEAMSCQKPVVFAGEGGLRGALTSELLPELRRHNFTARGASEGVTTEGLAKAIRNFLDNSALCLRAAEIGRSIVSSEYSWDALAPKVIETYEESLK